MNWSNQFISKKEEKRNTRNRQFCDSIWEKGKNLNSPPFRNTHNLSNFILYSKTNHSRFCFFFFSITLDFFNQVTYEVLDLSCYYYYYYWNLAICLILANWSYPICQSWNFYSAFLRGSLGFFALCYKFGGDLFIICLLYFWIMMSICCVCVCCLRLK